MTLTISFKLSLNPETFASRFHTRYYKVLNCLTPNLKEDYCMSTRQSYLEYCVQDIRAKYYIHNELKRVTH